MLAPVGNTAIHSDPLFYAAFPSILSRPSGELIVAFRRASHRRRLYAASVTHCAPDSYLGFVGSHDAGQTWSFSFVRGYLLLLQCRRQGAAHCWHIP
jgi:hypothetical protein